MSTPPRLTRDQRRAQTRAELLTSAADVFAAKGFHAASVDDVAEAAGFTKGAIYSNFTSKEELFLALFEQGAAQTVSVIDEILQAPPDERIARFGRERERLAFFSPQWQMLEAEFALYVARNPRLRPQLLERHHVLREQLGQRVQRHLDDLGARTPHDPLDLARLIGAAGDGLTMQQFAEDQSPAEISRLFSLLLELVLRGATADANGQAG